MLRGKFVVIGVKRGKMSRVGEADKRIKLEDGIAEKEREDCK